MYSCVTDILLAISHVYSCVIERFGNLLNMCVEVLHDTTDTDENTGTFYE